MTHAPRQAGFSFVELLLAIIVLTAITLMSWRFLSQTPTSTLVARPVKQTVNNCQPLHSHETAISGRLTINAPCNNAKVSSSFRLSGIAPTAKNGVKETLAITINKFWRYLPPNYRATGAASFSNPSITPGQPFSVSMNLVGSMVAFEKTQIASGEEYTYDAVTAGKNTFTISIGLTASNDGQVGNDPRVNLTLYVQW